MSKRKTIVDKIREIQASDPHVTARQLADQIGSSQSTINYAAKKHGISIRRLTAAERQASQHHPTSDKARAAAEKRWGKTSGKSKFNPAVSIAPKKGAQEQTYHLRSVHDANLFLHESGMGLVDCRKSGLTHVWKGTRAQLKVMQEKSELARGLVEEPAK